MPFNVDQLNFLSLRVGVAIPPELIENKKQAELYQKRTELFASRSAEIKGRADAADVESLIAQAKAAADGKKFADGFRLLDQAEERLKQPDIPPEVVAALKELAERRAALQDKVARLKVLESPIGGEFKSGLDAVDQAIKERKADAGGKRLGELEKMVTTFEQKKAATDAAAAKAQAQELAKLKQRVEKLNAQVEKGLEEIRKVVASVTEAALSGPPADALKKLEEKLAATKTLEPAAQEAALDALSKEIAPVKSATDKAAVDFVALVAARKRVAELKQQVEKEMSEADTAIKAIGEPTLTVPEEQKFAALKQRQATTSASTDLKAQEKDYADLLADIEKLKQAAGAAKVKADEIKAAQVRIAQLEKQVDAALAELEKVINGLKEKVIKDDVAAQQTPLTQERTRIASLTALDAKEAALKKLETDTAAVKKDADDMELWDKWLKDPWETDYDNTQSWIDDLKQAAVKSSLTTEIKALQAEKETFLAALNLASIEKATHPKLLAVYKAATRVSDHSPEVDVNIHKLRNLVIAVRDVVADATVTTPILDEFNKLNNEKRTTWPVGADAAALQKEMDKFDKRVEALRAQAEGARNNLVATDTALREQMVDEIAARMSDIDQILSDCEGQDWKKVAKLPPQEKAPLLKMKVEFDAARKSHQTMAATLKKILPWKSKNPPKGGAALGRDIVKMDKDTTALWEQILRRMAKLRMKMDGAAALDKELRNLPDTTRDPKEISACKVLIEARFGIKIDVGEEFQAKSLPRLGKLLTRVPEWHVKQSKVGPDGAQKGKSLKNLTYSTEPLDKGNYYSSDRKGIALQEMTEKGGADDELTMVADSGKAVKGSYFDLTTLHEVGHAVDDRINFMGQRMDAAGFGKWKKETFDSVLGVFLPGLVAACTGGTKKAQAAELELMLTDLIKTGKCAKPANATDKLGSLFDEWDDIQKHESVTKCQKGIHTGAKPWNGGKSHAEAVELAGRVYHEAYEGSWYSYALAERAATGVSTYQWRAPGEWFAELYAFYYANKMSRSHPMSAWFRNAAGSEAEAVKV